MSRRARTAVLACLLPALVAGLILTAAPAAADTPGCVSRGEYRRVDNPIQGLPRTQQMVRRLFDTRGRQIARGGGYMTVTYPACWTKQRRVYIGYRHGFGWVSQNRVDYAWFFEHKALVSGSGGDGDGW